jgi:hypothetical protein
LYSASGYYHSGPGKNQEKFLLAARYEKFTINDPAMVAGYAAPLRSMQNVYSRELEDLPDKNSISRMDKLKPLDLKTFHQYLWG